GADEAHAQPRACDGRAAETRERIHRERDASRAVEPEALLRKLRGKRRWVRAIAIAALDRLVGDEPRIAAAADALRGPVPSPDVRLILIRHAEREAIERRRAFGREVEDELVAVVQEPIAVDRLVVPDGEVAREPRRRARGGAVDRDRLDP